MTEEWTEPENRTFFWTWKLFDESRSGQPLVATVFATIPPHRREGATPPEDSDKAETNWNIVFIRDGREYVIDSRDVRGLKVHGKAASVGRSKASAARALAKLKEIAL